MRLKVRVTLLRVRIAKTSDSLKFSFCNFANGFERKKIIWWEKFANYVNNFYQDNVSILNGLKLWKDLN